MKSLTLLRTAPGALLAIAIVATTSVGAYALTNWFNGEVTVKQANSVLSVDLSACKGNLPPGIEQQTDRHNVQFKILSNPHVSADQLQHKLLVECEYNAVVDFYRTTAGDKNYAFHPSTVKAINGPASITLDYFWGGKLNEKTVTLPQNANIYDQGKKTNVDSLKVGDHVVLVVSTPSLMENVDPLASVSEAQSIFKTQYDTQEAPSATKKAFYEESNIMPLGMYDQLNK